MNLTQRVLAIGVVVTLAGCMSMQPPPPPSVISALPEPEQGAQRFILVTLPMASMSQLMQTAKDVGREYSLQNRAAWMLKTIKIHCVVYEIADARSRSLVINQLTTDSRIDSRVQPTCDRDGRRGGR